VTIDGPPMFGDVVVPVGNPFGKSTSIALLNSAFGLGFLLVPINAPTAKLVPAPIAAAPIEGVESFYIGTEQVEVDSEGFVTTPKYTRDGQRLIRFYVYDGNQLFLPYELVSASAGALGYGDSASGISWVYVRWEAVYDVFGQIGIPEFRFVVKGKKLYDPRTNTTYYSNNPALVARDYLTSSMGLRCLASEINNADVIASANICDENVSTPSGATQKRYSINGALSTENNLKGNLELISFAMSGMLFWSQGQWSIQAGAYQTPVTTIDESKIIEVENVTAFSARRDIFNTITGTFIAANDLFVEKQFPVVANADLMALDGEKIERNINYPLITDATIAQRLPFKLFSVDSAPFSVYLFCVPLGVKTFSSQILADAITSALLISLTKHRRPMLLVK